MTIIITETAARIAARTAFERHPVSVLEIDLDACANTYGVAPCTASGATKCYNCYATCQDRPHYVNTTRTVKFTGRGSPIPPGELVRPYILSDSGAATVIEPENGMARRATLSIKLADEPCGDYDQDPYYTTRAAAAQGTFWTRLLARNPNYAGRFARYRRGFAVNPWDWTTFLTELYIVDQIAQAADGTVSVTLKDPLKLTDTAKIPAPTDGKLAAAMKAVENNGNIVSATGTTAVLASTASAVDGAYDGMELYLTANTGSGQRRTITAYTGASRTCTVAAWSVTPDTTSTYEVGALSITLPTGKGAQYKNPATTGRRELVRIGEEIIEYTALSGDTLSWPDTSYRAQFGTIKADHGNNDNVQQCLAFFANTMSYVLQYYLNAAGILNANIDLAQIASEDATWLGDAAGITACVSAPEAPSAALAELLDDTNSVMWWSPRTQEVEFKVMMPRSTTPAAWDDIANIISGSVAVESLDGLRITTSAQYFNQDNATSNAKEPKNFSRAEVYTDAAAVVEYAADRPETRYSRWMRTANQGAVRGFVARRTNWRRDAPKLVKLRLDPKDYATPEGELVDITTRLLTDFTGTPIKTRCLITKAVDMGKYIEIEARTTVFARRYGFIAANGSANYPTETAYAHIAQSSGVMSDGGEPYRII